MSAEAWIEARADFESHLRLSDRKWATNKQYLQHIGWLAETAPAGPWDLTASQLSSWVEERGWSTGTRRKVLVSFRMFYAWAVSSGRCEWAPTAGLAQTAVVPRGPKKRPLPEKWREPVEAFTTWGRSAGRAESTLLERNNHISNLAQVAADPWSITTEQLAQFVGNPDWARETKRSRRATFRTFYRWAMLTKRTDHNPADDLEKVRIPYGVPRPALDPDVMSALARANERTRLMIMFGALAGLRRAEISRVHTSDFNVDDLEAATLLVKGKGDRQRIVPLHPDLVVALRAEMGRRRRGERGEGWTGRFVSDIGYLFPSDLHAGPLTPAHVGKILSGALPSGWTAHNLRHRFATSAYAVERDLRAVQDLLGHATPMSTARYAAVPDGAKRSAVAGAGLRFT